LVDSVDHRAYVALQPVEAHADGKAARTQRHTSAAVHWHIGGRVRTQVDAICNAIGVRIVIGDPATTDSRIALVRIIRTAVVGIANPVAVGIIRVIEGTRIVGIADAITVRVVGIVEGAWVHAIKNTVTIGVDVGHAATASTRFSLRRVIRASINAIWRTILVAIRLRHSTAAFTGHNLVPIQRAPVAAAGNSVAIRIVDAGYTIAKVLSSHKQAVAPIHIVDADSVAEATGTERCRASALVHRQARTRIRA
jgi:hypothetical protein